MGEYPYPSNIFLPQADLLPGRTQTAEHLTAENLGKAPVPAASSVAATTLPPQTKEKGDRSRSQFIEDPDVPAMFRAQLKDCEYRHVRLPVRAVLGTKLPW